MPQISDEETHDRLVRYDRLTKEEGHTTACAAHQVFRGGVCNCGKDSAKNGLTTAGGVG